MSGFGTEPARRRRHNGAWARQASCGNFCVGCLIMKQSFPVACRCRLHIRRGSGSRRPQPPPRILLELPATCSQPRLKLELSPLIQRLQGARRSARTAGPLLNEKIGLRSVEAGGGCRHQPGVADTTYDTLAVMHQLKVKDPDSDQAEAIVEIARTAAASGIVTRAVAESFRTFDTLVGMEQSCVCSPRGPGPVLGFRRKPHLYLVRPGAEAGASCLAGTGLPAARQARLGSRRDLP